MIRISPVKVENKKMVEVKFNSTKLLYYTNYAELYLKTDDGVIFIEFWNFERLENDIIIKKIESKKSVKIKIYKCKEKVDEFIIPIGSKLEILKCHVYIGYLPRITIRSNKS